jgi:hypothetical protein
MPARRRARFAASTGAKPKNCGSLAAAPRPAMRARGCSPVNSAAFSEPSSAAEAPSFSGEALPAVTVPPCSAGRNTVFSPPSFSTVEDARTDSSWVSSVPGTGTVRSS